MLERGADGDDSIGPRHLELEVDVVWDSHELCVTWSPKNGVVGTVESHHVKSEGLLEVGGIPKGDG